MKIRTLVFPGHAGSSDASHAKHSEALDSDGRHADAPDIPLYPVWYLQWSGDTVTLDGETFLDMQVAPHHAEASTLAKQSGAHCEENEAMNNITYMRFSSITCELQKIDPFSKQALMFVD